MTDNESSLLTRFADSMQQAILSTSDKYMTERCLPTVVISTDDGNINEHSILARISDFSDRDDVFCSDFLSNTLVIQRRGSHCLTESTIPRTLEMLVDGQHWKVCIRVLDSLEHEHVIPNGPYFLVSNNLRQAWKLFPDYLDAFQTTCIPSASRTSA